MDGLPPDEAKLIGTVIGITLAVLTCVLLTLAVCG